MPRLPRYVLPGQPQHVIQRGNNRCPIFIVDKDYSRFRDYLLEACIRHGCHVHAYILMTNHVHLLITPDNENSIAKVMQSVGRRYVQYFNRSYQRTGTLWEGRYKATLIDSENYFFTCCRYIELNPVRANIVVQPADYPWSSHHANAFGKRDDLVDYHKLYLALDVNEQRRQTAYRELFNEHIDEKTLGDIRHATQKGWVMGCDYFKDGVEQLLQRRTRPLVRGGDHRSVGFRKLRG